MKRWRVPTHGGNEVLAFEDAKRSEPKSGETLVKMEAVGLNHLDLWVRNGVPGHNFPLPLTPGCDVVGTVEAWGSREDEAKLKEAGIKKNGSVIVNPILSCGECSHCLTGFEAVCGKFGLIGETTDGGLQEYVTVPTDQLIARPEGVSSEEAASLPIAFITAYSMIHRKAKLRKGEKILVQAGGSGVGVAAIQMAKALGATVFTTVGSDEKAKKAKSLGADQVYRYDEFREKVDVVLDHVGQETFERSLKSLNWGGRLVICGATTGADVRLNLKPLFFKNLSVLGSTMGGKKDLEKVLELISSRKIRAVVDRVMKLDELPEAFELLESRALFGKIVLKPK